MFTLKQKKSPTGPKNSCKRFFEFCTSVSSRYEDSCVCIPDISEPPVVDRLIDDSQWDISSANTWKSGNLSCRVVEKDCESVESFKGFYSVVSRFNPQPDSMYHHFVYDQNEKEFAKSKALSRERRRVKGLERSVKDQRQRISSLLKTQQALKDKLEVVHRKELKYSALRDDDVSDQNWLSKVGHTFYSVVDVNRAHADYAQICADQACCSLVLSTSSKYDVVRAVVMIRCSQHFRCNLSFVKSELMKRSSPIRIQYETWFSELPTLNHETVSAFKTWYEEKTPVLDTTQLDFLECRTTVSGPSALAKSSLTAVKLATFALELAHAPNWTAIIISTVRMITYTATPVMMEYVLSFCDGDLMKHMLAYTSPVEEAISDQNFFDGLRATVRAGIGLEEKIAEIPLANFIDQVVCLLVFFYLEEQTPEKFETKADVVPSSKLWKDLVFRATKIHKTDTLSMFGRVCTIIDQALMIADTIYSGNSYLTLINPLDINLRLAKMQGFFNAYKAGNLETMADAGTEMTATQFEEEVLKLSADIEMIVQKRIVKPTAMRTYTAYLSQVIDLKQYILTMRKSRMAKLQPLFIGLYSLPGVGKTGLSYDFRALLEIAHDTVINVEHESNGSTDNNGWQNGFTSATKFLNISEVDNKKDEESKGEVFFDAARMCDNKPCELPQAAAELKGLCWNHLIGACFACNQRDFGLTSKVKCVGASNRRTKFFEISVKEQYGKVLKGNFHYVPDSTKIPMRSTPDGDFPEQDIYLIQQYVFCERDVKGDDSGEARQHWIEKVGEPMEVSEWLEYLLETIRELNQSSAAYNKVNEQKRQVVRCSGCGNMAYWCRCSRGFSPSKVPMMKPIPKTFDYWACVPTKQQAEYQANRLKDYWCSTIGEFSLSGNKHMSEIVSRDLSRFLDSTIKDENLSDYGLFGEVVQEVSPWLMCANVNFSLSFSYWLTKIFGSFIKTSLTSVFNLRNSIYAALLFIWYPPAALIVFFVMFFMSCTVATSSEYLMRRVIARRIVRGEPNKYWSNPLMTVAAGFTTVAALYATYQYMTPKTEEAQVEDNGGLNIVTSQDIKNRLEKPDEWEKRVVYKPTAPERVHTATVEQVFNVYAANSVMLKTPLGNIRGVMVYANVALAAVHDTEIYTNQCLSIHRNGCQGSVLAHVESVHRICTDKETDIAAIVFNIRLPIRNIIDYFDHSYTETSPPDSLGGCTLFSATPQVTLPTIQQVATTRRKFLGISAPIQTPTVDGDCGLPLIRNHSPCVIVGLHVAIKGNKYSHCPIISKKNILHALKDVLLDQGRETFTLHDNVLFDNVIETMNLPSDVEPSPRVATRWMRTAEDEGCPFSITPYGYVKERVSAKSEVQIGILSKFLESEGLIREHGPPPLNNNRAASKFLRLAARNPRPRAPNVNDAVINSYVGVLSHFAHTHALKLRTLSVEEAMQGIFGNAYAKAMNLSTSSGGGYPGKKRRRVDYRWNPDEDEYFDLLDPITLSSEKVRVDFDDVSVFSDSDSVSDMRSVNTDAAVLGTHEKVPVPNSVLKREASHILKELKARRSCNHVNQVALKDEPIALTKLAKGDFYGRPITSLCMAHHLVDTIIYGDIAAFLRAFPLTSGCWEGISPYSEDWHQVMTYIGAFKHLIDMDTKKMDQTQNFQDTYSVFEVFARLVEELNDEPTEFAHLIRSRGLDLSTPILDLFGEWVAVQMNTSGNKLTITINDIAGVQLRAREAYIAYKHREKTGITDFPLLIESMDDLTYGQCAQYLSNFDRDVRVGSVGDDALLSTMCEDFNLPFISGYFAAKGVTITGASKGDERLVGMKMTDLKMCKRGVRWMPEAQRLVGPLEETSILRPLHCYLPSKEDRDVIEADCVAKAFEEFSLHGREVFEDRKAKITRAIEAANRTGIHHRSLSMSYDDHVASFLRRFPTSDENITLSDPLLKDQNGLTNQREARVVHNASRLRSDSHYPECERLRVSERLISSGLILPLRNNTWISNTHTNTQELGSTEEQQQNIKMIFPDSAMNTDSASHSMSPMYRTVSTRDSSIDMIERPVKLKVIPWNVGTEVFTTFNPWLDMLSSPLISSRMQHYRHFRAHLKLTVTVEGSNFHYGECWMIYNMLNRSDNFLQFEKGSFADLVEASQRPYVKIQARNSLGGELICPFVYPRDFIDLTRGDVELMGNVTVASTAQLGSANGTTHPCLITVLGKFENVELYTPTSLQLDEIVDQNEFTPVDSPDVGTVANLSLTPPHLSTDPGVTWDSSSETSFAQIGGRETFIGQVVWNTDSRSNSMLFNLRCSPFHGITVGAGITAEHHVTPAAYVGLPFSMWRGTCKYRFEVISSNMHRGKLRVVYDSAYSVRPDEYNLNYSSIIDIGSQTEHIAKIGWSQDTTFLPTIEGMSEIDNFSDQPYTGVKDYANGTLALYVHSPLVSPSPDFGKVVKINVYASMEPDYELALIRSPLAGANPHFRNVPTDLSVQISEKNPQSGSTQNTPTNVLNTNSATARTFILCEAPFAAFALPQLTKTVAGATYNDHTLDANQGDTTLNNVTSDSTMLVNVSPFDPTQPVSFSVSDFTTGPQRIEVQMMAKDGTVVDTKAVITNGISQTEKFDINFPPVDVRNPQKQPSGIFNFTSSERFRIEKIRLQLPEWLSLTLLPIATPTAGAIGDFLKWYEDGDLDFSSPLPSVATVTGPALAKFNLPNNVPENAILSRIVFHYTANGDTLYQTDEEQDLLFRNTEPGQARVGSFPYDPDGYFRLLSGTITPRQIRIYFRNDSKIRTTIKDQNEISSCEEFYGPKLKRNVEHDFVQEVMKDIKQPMSIFHTYRAISTNNGNTTTPTPARLGVYSTPLTHFPQNSPDVGLTIPDQLCLNTEYPHYVEYFSRMFAAVRGSMEVEIMDTAAFGPRKIIWAMIVRTPGVFTIPALTTAPVAGNVPTPVPPAGCEYMNIQLNGKGSVTLPWYHRERFGYARSVDPLRQHPYHYRLTVAGAKESNVNINYKIGKDFSLSHFISTPILRQ